MFVPRYFAFVWRSLLVLSLAIAPVPAAITPAATVDEADVAQMPCHGHTAATDDSSPSGEAPCPLGCCDQADCDAGRCLGHAAGFLPATLGTPSWAVATTAFAPRPTRPRAYSSDERLRPPIA